MILNFLLLQKYFESDKYENFSDILESFIKTEQLIKEHGDILFYSLTFYNDFRLYNTICMGLSESQKLIPLITKREYDWILKFFSKNIKPFSTDSFQDFVSQAPTNQAVVGLFNYDLEPQYFISTIQSWYKIHYNYFISRQEDNSYFAYSEEKHFIIEKQSVSNEDVMYFQDIRAFNYVDIKDKEESTKPNQNPNWGKGFFIVEDEYYFIFPNLDYSNTIKRWDLIYAKPDEKNKKEEKEYLIYKAQFKELTKKEIATNFAKIVAETNFYIDSKEISKHNNDHNKNAKTTPYVIYRRGTGRHQTFLSVDFEKCTFEVHNHKGEHIGEYRLDGKRNQLADTTGKHNILIP